MNSRQPVNSNLYFLLFMVGATGKYDLALIARVPLSEIIAFGAIPFLLRGVPWSRFAHRMRTVLILLGLWVLGVIISDFVNTFEISRFVRGIAKPVWCFLWLLFFIGVLCKAPVRYSVIRPGRCWLPCKTISFRRNGRLIDCKPGAMVLWPMA